MLPAAIERHMRNSSAEFTAKAFLQSARSKAGARGIGSCRDAECLAMHEILLGCLISLADRVDELECESAGLRYVGTWKKGTEYMRGNFVTHNGGVWHCDQETTDKPGASNDWTLAVKSGRS